MRGMRGTRRLLCDSGRCSPARAAALGWLTDSASLSAGHRMDEPLSNPHFLQFLSLKLWHGGGGGVGGAEAKK